jgi:anti-sigma B factor antagonist
LVPLVGGLHIPWQSGLEDLEGNARAKAFRTAPTHRPGPVGHGESPPGMTDMTSEGSFPPVSIVTTGPASASLTGELDMAGISTVRAALAHFEGDISIDCSGLTFIDAAGLEVLIDAQSRCERRGTRLVLVNPSRCLTRLLGLTNLEARFNLSSRDEPS